jgi:DNA-binding CsgD family transcriptional regulator
MTTHMISKPTGSNTLPPVLTSSEKDILQMIAEGHKLDDIVETLALSESEIERLMTAAEEKLGAKNRLHAITIAVLNGHISIGPQQPE